MAAPLRSTAPLQPAARLRRQRKNLCNRKMWTLEENWLESSWWKLSRGTLWLSPVYLGSVSASAEVSTFSAGRQLLVSFVLVNRCSQRGQLLTSQPSYYYYRGTKIPSRETLPLSTLPNSEHDINNQKLIYIHSHSFVVLEADYD